MDLPMWSDPSLLAEMGLEFELQHNLMAAGNDQQILRQLMEAPERMGGEESTWAGGRRTLSSSTAGGTNLRTPSPAPSLLGDGLPRMLRTQSGSLMVANSPIPFHLDERMDAEAPMRRNPYSSPNLTAAFLAAKNSTTMAQPTMAPSGAMLLDSTVPLMPQTVPLGPSGHVSPQSPQPGNMFQAYRGRRGGEKRAAAESAKHHDAAATLIAASHAAAAAAAANASHAGGEKRRKIMTVGDDDGSGDDMDDMDDRGRPISEDERKRNSHINAEQKRRDNIKQAFLDLKNVLPALRDKPNVSKAMILRGATDFVSRSVDLSVENMRLRRELDELRNGAVGTPKAKRVRGGQFPPGLGGDMGQQSAIVPGGRSDMRRNVSDSKFNDYYD